MTLKITLGRHQLAVSLNRKRGRPAKTSFQFSARSLSRTLRRLFEYKRIREILGLNLAVVVLFTGTLGTSISAFSGNPTPEITTLTADTVALVTTRSVRVPVDSFQITQGYHFFHQAIDLKEMLGAPVYPIMEGVVESVSFSRFSYGNHVIIDHGSGFRSLYAHLGKIVVQEGEAVDKNTVIGTIGLTGWTTGPHLHLEVYDNDRPINPLTILK